VLFSNSKDQEFFRLLRAKAENAVETANLLSQLLADPKRHPELCPAIKELESKGDHYTHDLFALINKTFVTPLEREDLATLGVALDSVVDSMEAAAARIGIYRVAETDKFLKSFGQILRAQAAELVAAIDLLAGNKLLQIREKAFQINVLENQGDEMLRTALTAIFEHAAADPVRFVTMKEIYETLETATDDAETVANTLEGVVMKHA
jgi:predicted phosphate transport protein (TIGR00153 family)